MHQENILIIMRKENIFLGYKKCRDATKIVSRHRVIRSYSISPTPHLFDSMTPRPNRVNDPSLELFINKIRDIIFPFIKNNAKNGTATLNNSLFCA